MNKKTTFENMKDLLLLLCHYPYDPLTRERLKELLNQVEDWNNLVNLINSHGIIALAAYNIKEAGLENEIPLSAMDFLENGYRQSVVRNLWLKQRWKEVNEILEKAGIKHILLKGMALEHTIYGARGLRQMNDNDILIRREEAIKAWYLLQKEGFALNIPKSPLHIKIMRDIGNHLPALYKEGYSVEIHTELFDYKTRREMGHYDPFENPVELNVDNIKALSLNQDLHLKYLLSHFKRHALSGECQLRLYADVLILSQVKSVEFQDQFILNPNLKNRVEFRKRAYKSKVRFVDPKYRLLFILGDLFPSIKWMKERYGCGGIKVFMYYPHRLGKLIWLV
jgi:hypothetical protein